jgi:hypothetical protein
VTSSAAAAASVSSVVTCPGDQRANSGSKASSWKYIRLPSTKK